MGSLPLILKLRGTRSRIPMMGNIRTFRTGTRAPCRNKRNINIFERRMNDALRGGSGVVAKLARENGNQNGFGVSGMLRRLTIVCLMIAGFAAVASIFVDQRYNVYRDQPVIGPVAAFTQKHAGERP